MTVQEAAGIVYMLHTAYIGMDRKATDKDLADRINLYAVTFADYDVEIVREAAMHCIKACTFMPSVSELLEGCKRARLLAANPAGKVERLTATAASGWSYEKFEEFCRWIGLGYDVEQEDWLPYET